MLGLLVGAVIGPPRRWPPTRHAIGLQRCAPGDHYVIARRTRETLRRFGMDSPRAVAAIVIVRVVPFLSETLLESQNLGIRLSQILGMIG